VAKHLPFTGVWIGTTRELLKMRAEGKLIRYTVCGSSWDVTYNPRNAHDPQPWTQVDGAGFRFRSSELHAEDVEEECICEIFQANADRCDHCGRTPGEIEAGVAR